MSAALSVKLSPEGPMSCPFDARHMMIYMMWTMGIVLRPFQLLLCRTWTWADGSALEGNFNQTF